MRKCYIELVYDTYPKPLPVALTDDLKTVVMVKRQILKEAMQRYKQVQGVDSVLEIEFLGTLKKLENTLNAIIPPSVEELVFMENEDADD